MDHGFENLVLLFLILIYYNTTKYSDLKILIILFAIAWMAFNAIGMF